jgi:hypothetical protein
MSITAKSPLTDRRLERFFRTQLLAVAQQYRREGRSLLAGNPDPAQPTYFHRRSKTRMTKADFESGSCCTTDELVEALRQMWQQEGLAELAELAPQLAKFAEQLKQMQPDTEEVSPFVYAMY